MAVNRDICLATGCDYKVWKWYRDMVVTLDQIDRGWNSTTGGIVFSLDKAVTLQYTDGFVNESGQRWPHTGDQQERNYYTHSQLSHTGVNKTIRTRVVIRNILVNQFGLDERSRFQ